MRKYDILSVDESLETLMVTASSLEDKGYQVTKDRNFRLVFTGHNAGSIAPERSRSF
jgi:hypothetical protein